MPLKLDVDRILLGKSERVKCVDIHPSEPWVLSALYSGNVFIWNFETEVIVRTFEVSEVPVRAAKFVVRKNWFVCGSDDMLIRVYNYNTCAKVREFEAHTDYIRSIAVHPTLPFILSASDDMSIKLFDWDNGWENSIIFEGHTHYVMQVAINPKDTNCFASASLDRSVKVWGLNSSVPHFQLEGHERGVNCVSYYSGGERPFLCSGADDNMIKIWDYQTKTCVATLKGHTANISAVMFHPSLPVILSGSEDGSIKIWHSNTYSLETTLHYSMERVWAMCCVQSETTSNKVAIGFDEGTIMIKLGNESAVVSMDNKTGKVIWAKNHEIQLTSILKHKLASIVDGEQLQLSSDDLGSCEFYPSYLQHNKNGQFVCVCGDGEYTIYTALRLRNKSFGSALEFVWSGTDRSQYATKESGNRIKIYKNFEQHSILRTNYQISKIFGGYLLGVSSASEGFIDFYSWNDDPCKLIRRIEVLPKTVYWNDGGTSAAVICDDNFYVLRYNEELVDKYLKLNVEYSLEQGIEKSFQLEQDVNQQVLSGCYSGEIFIYVCSSQRLNYYVGGQIITLTHLDKASYRVLGYIQKSNRVYLCDKALNIISYELRRYVLAYQAAVVRDDIETANMLIERKKIDESHYNKLAHFLENQGKLEMALELSIDYEHKFELALQLKKLKLAKEILMKSPSTQKWKQLADLALSECDFATVQEASQNANDLSLLYLLYSSSNNVNGLLELIELAKKKKKFNIAFNCLFYLNDIKGCIDLLIENGRIPQAAMMARSYCPSKIDEIMPLWMEQLKSISPTAAKSLGDRETHPDAFPSVDSIVDDYKEVKQDDVVDDAVENVNDNVNDNEDDNDDNNDDITPTIVTKKDSNDDEINDITASLSDDVSMPSGMDDDNDNDNVLNGDDDDGFDIDDINVDSD